MSAVASVFPCENQVPDSNWDSHMVGSGVKALFPPTKMALFALLGKHEEADGGHQLPASDVSNPGLVAGSISMTFYLGLIGDRDWGPLRYLCNEAATWNLSVFRPYKDQLVHILYF